MSALPLRPLGFGEVLDYSFQLYRKDFAAYTSIALLGLLPAKFLGVLSLDASNEMVLSFTGTGGLDLAAMASALGMSALAILAVLAVDLALAVGMASGAQGHAPPATGWCYRRGARRLPRLVASGLVVMAAVGLLLAFWTATTILAVAFVARGGLWLAVPTAALGMACGVLAGIWLVAGTAVLLPVVALEEHGPASSLRRSFRLARGATMRTAAVIAVAAVMMSLPAAAVATFTGTWQQLTEGASSVVAASGAQRWLWEAVGLLVASVTTPLWVACKMLLFHDRRVRAEGYDIEAAAGALAS